MLKKYKKYIILIIVIIILIIVTMLCIPYIKKLMTQEGQNEFKKNINKLGILGFFILFGMELLQIFLAFLPGEPIEVLAGICYGPIWGTIFLLASICLSNTIIFILVKKYGHKFVYNFANKEKVDKVTKSEIFNNTKFIEIILVTLFIIPGTPKDFLIYIGGLLPISMPKFIFIATFARIPSIVSSTIVGASVFSGNWIKIALIYAVTFAISFIILFIINKCDKDKVTPKAINTVK